MELAKPVCLLSKIEEDSWLWHARYGHTKFQTLKRLEQDKLVIGLPKMTQENQVCDSCLVSKQHRSSFPRSSSFQAKARLELVHADLCGPIAPTTAGGSRYFLLMVDDFSKYMWVEFLSDKSDAFVAFKRVKQEAELESGCKLKVLRTDRGGEFTSHEFTEYCSSLGIKRHLTAPYSPQQNGVVERRNQTVIEMTRSLMKSKGVPMIYWGEAVRTSVYILNRSYTRSLQEMTPYEAWNSRVPKISHLRIFGSLAHVKNVKPHLSKLEDRSVKLVFIGYETGSKAYRFLNPETNKVVVSRDAVFHEKEQWDWAKDDDRLGKEPNIFTVDIQGDSSPPMQSQTPTPSSPQSAMPSTPTSQGIPEPITDDDSSSEGPRGLRVLQDIYDSTLEQDLELELCLCTMEEPNTYDDAAEDRNWRFAMKEELESIRKAETWALVDLPKGHKAIGLRWVYKVKKNPEGEIIRYKARLVAKGYVQKKGIDFEEVFAPVARMETVRLLLAIAAQEGWIVHHMDVKSAFLNGELEEEVYVAQPIGFEEKGHLDKVLKLKKALYGLKQAPRAWNAKLDKCLKGMGFEKTPSEAAVYVKKFDGEVQIVGVYVDDLIITGSRPEDTNDFKDRMKSLFEMSDLGPLCYYLGIEVKQSSQGIHINQSGYAAKVLEKMGMQDCKACTVPMDSRSKLSKDDTSPLVDSTMYRSIIGSLRYLINTRPDLALSVGIASRFMEAPTENHLAAVKQILRYIKGTLNLGIVLRKCGKEESRLVGYCDSDLAGDVDDRKSTTGVIYFLGKSPIAWLSQKQRVVALSSCEAEYISATAGVCQGIWLQRLLKELKGAEVGDLRLLVDNKSAIDLAKNPVHHERSKHIDIKYHFIRDCVQKGVVEIDYVKTEEQCADFLTKPLGKSKLEEHCRKNGMAKTKN